MARQGEIFDDIHAANVVDLADRSALENRPNCAAMILHAEPIALLLAIAVNRQGFIVERVGDHERKKFLRKLKRSRNCWRHA